MYCRSLAPIPFPYEAEIPSPPLPVPSPPTTSPTYAEAPLGYKVVEIRRRADIPKADIPPRKRLLLTAPTPRFKVGESSVATTRQPGSTMACRVDYGFMDTVDASIRASERRTTAAIEMVNLRVSYQAEVCRRESKEFYTRHQDAQRYRVVILDEVGTLRSVGWGTRAIMCHEWQRHEWQRQDADDHATRAIMRIQALYQALIAKGVADALAERDADKSRNGDDNHDSGSDGRRRMPVAREGKIKNLEIEIWNLIVKGIDVESYTQRFQELALLCRRMFLEESDKVKKYVGGLSDMIQGSVMASKPKKMQDAIEFATELMDQKILLLALNRQDENKREFRGHIKGTIKTNNSF
ncbi:hypothetical protein Tco_0215316 [Tanacetum coccineum]